MLSDEDRRKIEEPFNQALALRDQGDLQGSLQLLSAIAESYPIAAVFGVTGTVYEELGDLENAMKCFQRAVNLSPKSELASLNLFHALYKAGNKARAFTEMSRFLALSESEEYKQLERELRREIEEYTRPSNNN